MTAATSLRPDTIERAAEAAYRATMTMREGASLPFEPWEKLPEHWKRIYRVQVAAAVESVLAEVLL